MSEPTVAEPALALPDHTQLPDKDGAIVTNYQEHPQSEILTASLTPRLLAAYPDGQFSIGQNSGIYWRYTDPPLAGCKAPDWFCVLGVGELVNGEVRRSDVLWQEAVAPAVVVEYVSGDGGEERDATPLTGKFWVYKQAIRAGYYVIFDGFRGLLEVYCLNGVGYKRLEPNERGRYPVAPLQVELGLWRGEYRRKPGWWLRAWDPATGELLPHDGEVAERSTREAAAQRQRATTAEGLLDESRQALEEETERAENERRRADRFAEKLRAPGIDPDA